MEKGGFYKGDKQDLSSKLYFKYGSNVNHYKSVRHPLSTLPVGMESILAVFKTKINNLFFKMSVQVYSFLSKTEGGGGGKVARRGAAS